MLLVGLTSSTRLLCHIQRVLEDLPPSGSINSCTTQQTFAWFRTLFGLVLGALQSDRKNDRKRITFRLWWTGEHEEHGAT
jgi:hypothetical protein